MSRKDSDHALQEYLEAVSNHQDLGDEARQRHLLVSYAEFKFKLQGGSHCAICHAAVRYVVPATVERDGRSTRYDCLCTRCLEGERATSRRVTLQLGAAAIEYRGRVDSPEPIPQMLSRRDPSIRL